MPEFRTEPLIVPTVSGLLPEGERNRRVALTSLPSAGAARPSVPQREVRCYECGRRSHVPAAALSAHCLHCHAHLNMADVELKAGSHRLTVRTLGDVTIAADAELSHLSIVCRNLNVNGCGSGDFSCSGRLNISTSLRVEGSVKADELCVERGCAVVLEQGARLRTATIRGKVEGRLDALGEVTIAKVGELAGDCTAAQLTIEPGGRHTGAYTVRGREPRP